MSYIPCPQGRLEALAMASMRLRAVIGPTELRFLTVPVVGVNSGPNGSTVPACLRPRDEGGRFARYSWLRDAIDFDYGATDMEFDAEPGVEVETGSAIGVDNLFPDLTDGLDDELAAEPDWASYFETGADGSHTNETFGLDGSVWPTPEWPGGAAQDPLGD